MAQNIHTTKQFTYLIFIQPKDIPTFVNCNMQYIICNNWIFTHEIIFLKQLICKGPLPQYHQSLYYISQKISYLINFIYNDF